MLNIIFNSIDAIKEMIKTFKLKRDTKQIQDIVNNLKVDDNILQKYRDEMIELTEKYIGLNREENSDDISFYMCICVQSIIEAMLNPTEKNLKVLKYEIEYASDLYYQRNPNVE